MRRIQREKAELVLYHKKAEQLLAQFEEVKILHHYNIRDF